MTVQVTTTPPGTSQQFSYDPTSDNPPQVPAGPGLLRFQDVLPDGTLGPVWGIEQLEVLAVQESGLRVRFPDATEVVLTGTPAQIAGILSEIPPAGGGDQGGGAGGAENGGSPAAFNAFVEDGFGNVFGLGADGAQLLIDGSGLGAGLLEDPNLLLTILGGLGGDGFISRLFTPFVDEVDLSGPISAFNSSFGPNFAQDGNINFALAGNDTVQLAGVGEPNNLNDLFGVDPRVVSNTFFGGSDDDILYGGDDGDSIHGDGEQDIFANPVAGLPAGSTGPAQNLTPFGSHQVVTASGSDQFDFYSFILSDAGPVVLEITAANFNSELFLYDAAGNLVENDENGGVGTFSRIATPLPAGTYFVVVGEFNSFDGGGLFDPMGNPLDVADSYDLTVRLGTVADGNPGQDTLYGNAGADDLTGDLIALISTGGNDLLYGGMGGDTLTGDASLDLLVEAVGGNDTLYGEDDADRLVGDAGRDLFDASQGGNDLLYGGGGDDVAYGDAGRDAGVVGSGPTSMPQAGDDTLYGDAGSDTLYGDVGEDFQDDSTGGDDLIYGDDGDNVGGDADVIFGDAGSDIAGTSDGGDDTLYGEGGDDTVYGDARGSINGTATGGGDLVYGGDGNDLLYGDTGLVAIIGGGTDTLYGGTGNDIAYGGSGIDLLYGDNGVVNQDPVGNDDDVLYGNAGADRIYGEADGDTLYGGNDNDILYGEDGVLTNVFAGNSEDDIIYGGLDDDIIYGQDDEDVLYGDFGINALTTMTGGADTLYGGFDDDTLYGEGGADVLYGDDNIASVASDLLYGGTGSDLLYGDDGDLTGGDADTLHGNDGTDTLYGEGGGDSLFGGDDEDLLYGGTGSDRIEGGDENDTLFGENGLDLLYGGDDDDSLFGDGGSDSLHGDGGADVLYGGANGDNLYGGTQDDTLYGGDASDLLYGDAGADTLFGEDADDNLYGGSGTDVLYGGANSDSLFGGTQDDTLYGEAGSDLLYGDAGDDLLYGGLDSSVDSIFGATGDDTVFWTIGQGSDVIDGGSTGAPLNDSDTDLLRITGNGGNNTFNVNLDDTGPTVEVVIGGETLTVDNVEDISIDGGGGADTLNIGDLTGTPTNVSTITFTGGGGNDRLDASDIAATQPVAVEATGDDGDDVLIGGAGDDLLYGGAGEDTFTGGAGDDLLYGGPAGDNNVVNGITIETTDIFYGGAGDDTIFGDANDAVFFTGDGSDYTITAIAGGFTVTDNDNSDGDDGTDTIFGIDQGNFIFNWDNFIQIQPIQVRDDAGNNPANANRELFELETMKIYNQLGIRIDFLNWNTFDDSTLLTLSYDGGADMVADPNEFTTITGDPTTWGGSATAVNFWFINSFFNAETSTPAPGLFGLGRVGNNGVAIADNIFTFNGGIGRLDTIAHELGHNLGIQHSDATANTQLMQTGGSRIVPNELDDIAPTATGTNTAQFNAGMIATVGGSGLVQPDGVAPDITAIAGLDGDGFEESQTALAADTLFEGPDPLAEALGDAGTPPQPSNSALATIEPSSAPQEDDSTLSIMA